MDGRHRPEGLIAAARSGDDRAREELLRAYRDLALSVARRACGRPVGPHDDEYSVALLALNDAVDTYDPAAGRGFAGYAALLVRRRLIDHLRRERRHRHAALEVRDHEGEEGGREHPAAVRAAQARWQDATAARELAEELRRYEEALQSFGLTLLDLVEATPRHRDTRERLQEVARVLAASPAAFRRLRETGRLPVRELARLTGVSRKVLESGRRYIIGIALILGGGFEELRAHLRAGRPGGG